MGHPLYRCWKRPDAKCSKCNYLGHETIICKNKFENHEVDACVVNEEEEDHLFVATCISSKVSTNFWLIDSGCTNHMTYDKSLFEEIKPTEIFKVRIENGDQILVEGKGTVVIKTSSGNKKISDVLYVPDIDQNLLSICQLIEKGYKVSFEDKHCFIIDGVGKEVLNIQRRGKHFLFDPMKDVSVEHEKDHRMEKLEDDPQIEKAQGKCEPARFKGAFNVPKEIEAMKELSMFQKNKIGKFKFKMQTKQEDMPKRFSTQRLHSKREVNLVHYKPKDKSADLFRRSLSVTECEDPKIEDHSQGPQGSGHNGIMVQTGACAFTQSQYDQIVQLLNQTQLNTNTSAGPSVNVAGKESGYLKWGGEGDW
ncbi:uncharacterized protein LOC129881690 [Solanum dulcamara]|uniref:uncharacterized protein LOC129881690 n=1 Tax=Solanum dulcamara TaxID=45834 RepID=UPI0024862C0C|nr:uncharacterized protein LOC129881690 [Solanum dulcamara]